MTDRPPVIRFEDWAIYAEAETMNSEPRVWFHLALGCMTGGKFITVEEARALAAAITAAADATQARTA